MGVRHPKGIRLKEEGYGVQKYLVYHNEEKIGTIRLHSNGVKSEWKIVGHDSESESSRKDAIERLLRIKRIKIEY